MVRVDDADATSAARDSKIASIFGSVAALKTLTSTIGEETQAQRSLLDSLEAAMSASQTAVRNALKSVQKKLASRGSWGRWAASMLGNCHIIVLFAFAVAIFVFVRVLLR